MYGYEFLFRSSSDACTADADQNSASTATIDLSLLEGAQSLTGGDRAFVNCTRELLLNGAVTLLPKDHVVIELLEQIPPDDDVLEAVLRLRARGYVVAVDDVTSIADRGPLVEIADIVKVDFLASSADDQKKIAERALALGAQPLAEKVETHAQYTLARDMGYTLFQGYYFCKPSTISTHDIPCIQLNHLQLLGTVIKPTFDLFKVEEAIRREPALCYRLLRYLNSAAFGLFPVSSIRYALTLLGHDQIRKWVSVVAAVGMAGRREAELIRMALMRARFCELMEQPARGTASDLFLVGLLSLLDAILDRPMSFVTEHIPIPDRCKQALAGKRNSLGQTLTLAIACERGDWYALPELCEALGCSESQVFKALAEAQGWVHELSRQTEF
ncbi:MAG TPA: HDOD domain-containing protein [Terriglobales bacterium]